MGIVNGVFVFEGEPRNSATAKLWQAAGFGSAPALDADEPDAGYQEGSTITTGTAYGGDGAYRWGSVPVGAYYVSCYYLSHRVWQYYYVESITELLDTEGDLLVKGASALESLGVGTEGYTLKVVSGVPAWAQYATAMVVALAYQKDDLDSDTWVTLRTIEIPAKAQKVYAHAIMYTGGGSPTDMGVRIMYNAVEKASTDVVLTPISWQGDGLGEAADLLIQGIWGPEAGDADVYSGAVYDY